MFAPIEGRAVVAAFDGGVITSDAGALLLGAADLNSRLDDLLPWAYPPAIAANDVA